jgi:type I restriction enzyme S subunit
VDPRVASPRFVYQWLIREYSNLRARGEGSQSNLNAKKVKQFPIPIPSLDEQDRIVAILDKFDALVNDVSVGLSAELVALRKQYEYYRDRLLSFEEAA